MSPMPPPRTPIAVRALRVVCGGRRSGQLVHNWRTPPWWWTPPWFRDNHVVRRNKIADKNPAFWFPQSLTLYLDHSILYPGPAALSYKRNKNRQRYGGSSPIAIEKNRYTIIGFSGEIDLDLVSERVAASSYFLARNFLFHQSLLRPQRFV